MFRRIVQIFALALFSFLFFHVCCPYPARPGSEQEGFPSHYADRLGEKERFLQAETFLWLDPSAVLASTIAGRFVFSGILGTTVILVACLFIPRGFCGYVCPFGTVFDFFDFLFAPFRRLFRFTRSGNSVPGSWSRLKYVSLAALVIAAVFGVSLAGFIAPIPVLTRFFVVVLSPLQTAYHRGWYQVPQINGGEIFSVALFLTIVLLGLIHHRFWCRNLCPTGALLSLVSRWRIFGKKTDSQKCNHCSRCVDACSFGAIERKSETENSTACVTCLKCETVCKNKAVSFGFFPRNRPDKAELSKPRRRFLFGSVCVALSGVFTGLTLFTRDKSSLISVENNDASFFPIRPPGSVPESEFLKRCLRCGECLRACPNNALQSYDLDRHGERLWTPQLVPDWSGCEPSCNNCGFVCPTGAIRALPLLEKRACRIGLAEIDSKTCLPLAGKEECQLCFDECRKAGYDAIEFMRIGTEIDEFGEPIEGSGFLAPVVLPEKCVGCGLCQTRCRAINVVQKGLINQSAIRVFAGNDREDRILEGSYRALRKAESEQRLLEQKNRNSEPDDYLPDFLL